MVQLTFYGIAKHVDKHPGGWSSWRYMEIFLGAQTLVAAVLAWFILGTPHEVRWLSEREKLMATTRVMSNHAGTDVTGKKRYDWGQVREAFMDPVLYLQFLNTFLATVPNGALTTFGGVLNQSFGFDKYEVTLLAAPRDVYSVRGLAASGLCFAYAPSGRLVRSRRIVHHAMEESTNVLDDHLHPDPLCLGRFRAEFTLRYR